MNRDRTAKGTGHAFDDAAADADSFKIALPYDAPRLSEVYTIRSYEVDAGGRLSPSALCNFMQEAAAKHADTLGVSVAHLQKENKTWMLSRLALQMKTYPAWQESLHVTTWPSGSRRLFALRNFLLHDARQRLVGAAATAWLIIDTLNHRPLRVDPFVKTFNPTAPSTASELERTLFEKIPRLDSGRNDMRFRIRYQDLDTNRHVNNVSFIEWIIESIYAEDLQRRMLTGLEINYLAEAFLGEFVVSRSWPLEGHPGCFLHSIIKEDGGQELVRARTAWERSHHGR